MEEKSPRNRKEQWIAASLAAVLICVAVVGITFSGRISTQYIVYLFAAFSVLLISTLVLFLAWEQQRVCRELEEHDRLRVSEEEYRIAAQQSGKTIYRYDIATKAARYATLDRVLRYPPMTENLPDSVIDAGLVSPESESAYRAFFADMAAGKPYGTGTFHLVNPDGTLIWNHADYTLITSEKGRPLYAIVSYYDVTEQREKEIAYERWRQTVEQLPKDKVALYEYNLTRDALHRTDGTLLTVVSVGEALPFAERVTHFVGNSVHPDEADACRRFLNRGRLLAAYHQGARTDEMEFRLIVDGAEPRWLRLSMQMVEYPDSADIKAYFMFEDVDEEKRRELALKARSEQDALTKALNRAAFIEKAAQVIKAGGHDAQHAFLLVDVDNYKPVNDVLGHAVGDRTLFEISAGIHAKLRQGDLFGRLGGDEFMICLVNIPYDAVIEKRASEICRLIQRVVDGEVKISASIGVAVYPRDGETFEELYGNADAALYRMKDGGGNGFIFYTPGMERGKGTALGEAVHAAEQMQRPVSVRKRTILIASDSDAERARLSAFFSDGFRVVEATGGAKALSAIQHYGTGLSVVLLERRMQDMDAAEILTRLRVNKGLASIPVIVINAEEAQADTLPLLEQGAADCLPRNADEDIIKLRVETAVGKSENDRLRIQNSYLLLQSEEEERYRNVIRSTGTVVLEYDYANNIFKYDPLTSQSLYGVYDDRPLWRILLSDGVADASDVNRMQQLTFRTAKGEAASQNCMTVLLKAANGELRYFRMCVLKMGDELDVQDRLLITLNDVHEEILSEQKLRQLVEHDPTTGLFNRAAFMEKAQAMIRENPPDTYVMAYFDINKFKVINDRFGHAAGDEFLRFIASAMTERFRDDTLCCRISADFFAVCTRHDERKLSIITEEFPQQTERYGAGFEITACFGLYVIDDPSLPVDAILDRAALAQAHIKGNYLKRYAYYDESLRRNLLEEQEIEGQMNAAMEAGQFAVYLQPQYSLTTGGIVGAEALVRWIHPERGVITPGRFVPIFERNGFISKLDYRVWESVSSLLRIWAERGLNMPVSVNISRVDLFDPRLADKLTELVSRYGVDPALLKLEITESAYAENPERMIAIVKRLQERGFSVEMDDFGSGYSSLNILKDVPVNALKLDLRFLGGEDTAGRGGSINNSVIRMAKWLNLPVVAEGVETQQQAEYLRSIGCDVAQGYLYAKPMPIADFEALMRETGGRAEPNISYYETALENANAFWNPNSLETLIFNSYVGGAAIIEYTDGEIELLRANDKYRSMLRITPEELDKIRFTPLSTMPDEDRKQYLTAIEWAIARNSENECVTRRIFFGRAEEDTLWIRTRLRPLARNSRRSIVYVAAEDVTAERRAQLRLSENRQALLAATAHTRLYFWTYDIQAGRAVQGKSSQEELSIPEVLEDYPESLLASGFIHPDFADTYRELHRALACGAREVATDLRSAWKDGYEWRKVRYTVVEDRDGKPYRAIGTSESLAAYKELERRFVVAAQQSGIITWVYDRAARRAYQDVAVDSAEQSIPATMHVPETAIEKGFVHPEDANAFRELYEEIDRGEKTAACLVRLKPANGIGSWRWYRLSYTLNTDKDGDTNLAIGAAVDVSDQIIMQKRFQDALQRYENEDWSRFANHARINLTRGIVETSRGTCTYEKLIDEISSRIPDKPQRDGLLAIIDREQLLSGFLEGTSRYTYECRILFDDGISRWVRTSIRLHLDPTTQDLYVLFKTVDIHSEKMRAFTYERVICEDYDFVTGIDTRTRRYTMISKESDDRYRPAPEGADFEAAMCAYAAQTLFEGDRARYCRELSLSRMVERLEAEGSYRFDVRCYDDKNILHRKRIAVHYIDRETGMACLTRMDLDKMQE